MAITLENFSGGEFSINGGPTYFYGDSDLYSAPTGLVSGNATIAKRSGSAGTTGWYLNNNSDYLPFTPRVSSNFADSTNGFYMSFFMQTATAIAAAQANFISFMNGANVNCHLEINSSGQIQLYDNSDTLRATSTAVINNATDDGTTFTHIEIYASFDSNGPFILHMDGTEEINDTNDISATGDLCDEVRMYGVTTYTARYDDIYWLRGVTGISDGWGAGSVVVIDQNFPTSLTPDTGDTADNGRWDYGTTRVTNRFNGAGAVIYSATAAAAGAVDCDGPSGHAALTGNDFRGIKFSWRVTRTGGSAVAHYGLYGNTTEGTTALQQSPDIDPNTDDGVSAGQQGVILEVIDEGVHCTASQTARIGIEKTSGGQDFEAWGMAATMLVTEIGANTETIVATTTPVATVTRKLTASRSIVTVGTGVVSFVDKFFKTIAASTTPVAAFVRKKPKAISVITTPVAVVAKQTNRFRSIVATSPGVAACSRNLTAFRTIVASTTPTAVVSGITKWFRAISATAGSTVLFAKAKQFTRAIPATTTPTAVLSKIQMYKRTVAATTTGIATVVRASTLARTITVTSTAAVLFTKRTLYDRAITVITTPVAVVNEVRSFLRTIAVTTTPVTAFAKKTYHLIEVITTPVAAFDWKMFLTITASTTPTATVTNDAGGLVSRDIIASTTPVASVTKAPTFVRVFTASTTPIAVLAKKFYRALTIAATAGSTVVFTKEFVLQRTIAATSPGVATVARALTAARTITASSTPVAVFNKTSSRFRTIAASSLGSALMTKGLLLHKTIVAVSTPVANVIKSFLNTAVISASSTPVVVFANVYKPKGGVSDHRHQHIISPGPSRRFKM